MKHLLSLFDFSGNWSQPFRSVAQVFQVDIKHGIDILEWDYKEWGKGKEADRGGNQATRKRKRRKISAIICNFNSQLPSLNPGNVEPVSLRGMLGAGKTSLFNHNPKLIKMYQDQLMSTPSKQPEHKQMALQFAREMADRFNPDEINEILAIVRNEFIERRKTQIDEATHRLNMLTKSIDALISQ